MYYIKLVILITFFIKCVLTSKWAHRPLEFLFFFTKKIRLLLSKSYPSKTNIPSELELLPSRIRNYHLRSGGECIYDSLRFFTIKDVCRKDEVFLFEVKLDKGYTWDILKKVSPFLLLSGRWNFLFLLYFVCFVERDFRDLLWGRPERERRSRV